MVQELNLDNVLSVKSKKDYAKVVIDLRNRTKKFYVRQFIKNLDPEVLLGISDSELRVYTKQISNIVDEYVSFVPAGKELNEFLRTCKELYFEFDKTKSRLNLNFNRILFLAMKIVIMTNIFEDSKLNLEENTKIIVNIDVEKKTEFNYLINTRNVEGIRKFFARYAAVFLVAVPLLSGMLFSSMNTKQQDIVLSERNRPAIVNNINQVRQNPEFAQMNRANIPNLKVPLPQVSKEVPKPIPASVQQKSIVSQIPTHNKDASKGFGQRIAESVKKTFSKSEIGQEYYTDKFGVKINKKTGIPIPPPGYTFWKKEKMKVTGYTPTGKGLMVGSYKKFEDGKTSIGKNAFIYDGVAVNPSPNVTYRNSKLKVVKSVKTTKFIPYGALVYVPHVGMKIADDTGRALKESAENNVLQGDFRVASDDDAKKITTRPNEPADAFIFLPDSKEIAFSKTTSENLTRY